MKIRKGDLEWPVRSIIISYRLTTLITLLYRSYGDFMLDVHRITTCLNNVKEGSTVKHNEKAKY